jgi:hypothetical protein
MVDRNGEPIEIPGTMTSATAASAMGLEKCVSDLIEASAKNLSEKDSSTCDPLTWAARNSHLGVLQYLLGKEADVESKSYGGLRPLHHACHVYNEEVITALLARKADPNSKDDAGNTPFHYACRRCGARPRRKGGLLPALFPLVSLTPHTAPTLSHPPPPLLLYHRAPQGRAGAVRAAV